MRPGIRKGELKLIPGLLKKGKSAKEIGGIFNISEKKAKSYIKGFKPEKKAKDDGNGEQG